MKLFLFLILGICFLSTNKLFEEQSLPKSVIGDMEQIDSISVIVRTFNLYLFPPTQTGFRELSYSEDSVYYIYPNDSVFSKPLEGTPIDAELFSTKPGLFNDFLLLYEKSLTSYEIDKINQYTFIGRILVDYYCDGVVKKSIFLNEGGTFILNEDGVQRKSSEAKLIFNKVFSNCDFVDSDTQMSHE